MASAKGTRPLEGVGVLVTRAAHQAEPLCELISRHGGTAIRFPALEILEPADPQPLMRSIARLDSFDCAVFISANAVNKALTRILARRDWPQSVRIAVIGKRSAEELKRFGLAADLYPKHKFNSEALLELPELQDVSGQRFVIFRGDGGREYLADTLRERGAEVEYVEAYRRVCPRSDPRELLRRWRAGEVNIVLASSAESLRNLLRVVGDAGKGLLMRTTLLVVSDRMVPLAEEMGFEKPPIVAHNATDDAVIEALLVWKENSRKDG